MPTKNVAVVIGRHETDPRISGVYRTLSDAVKSGASTVYGRFRHYPPEAGWVEELSAWGIMDGWNGSSWAASHLIETVERLRAAGIATPGTMNPAEAFPFQGPMVAKLSNGVSFRHHWNEAMFCANGEAARDVFGAILDRYQGDDDAEVVFRPFWPIREYVRNVVGMPIGAEWRTFWLRHDDQVHSLGVAHYWAGSWDVPPADVSSEALSAAEGLGRRAAEALFSGEPSNGLCVDVAEHAETGELFVVEVNCGTRSGLNGFPERDFYGRLAHIVRV